jgi:hypothetical protein
MKVLDLLKNTILEFLFPNLKKKTMNKIQKILVDFSKYTITALLDKAQTIIDSLTTNPNVPTPQPSVAELQDAMDDLTTASAAANTGGQQAKVIRDQKKEALIALLKQEAVYVTMVANGDTAIMLSAGFDISKIPSPIGPLPKPAKFIVSSPQKGWLQAKVKAIKGAKNYQFEYKKVEDTDWTVVSLTKTRLVVQGLESTKEYIARVLPIGASEERAYSDEITAVVI